ncbi:MAG: hypothetical protein ABL921_06790, partial [Pirellula sp.]
DFPSRVWQGALLTSVLAGAIMVACLRGFGVPIKELVLFDVACAAAVGAAVRPAIYMLKLYESQSRHSRLLMASWLTICILVGNLLVPVLGGVAR